MSAWVLGRVPQPGVGNRSNEVGAQQARAAIKRQPNTCRSASSTAVRKPAALHIQPISGSAAKKDVRLAMRQKSGRSSFLVYEGTSPHLQLCKLTTAGSA